MGRQRSQLKRGLLYGAIGALGGLALPWPAAIIAGIDSDGIEGPLLGAALWCAILGVVGFVLGACQPAPPAEPMSNVSAGGARSWELPARCTYVLVVGSVIGVLFAGYAEAGWVGVLFLVVEPVLAAPAQHGLAARAVLSACGGGVFASGAGGLAGGLLGAALGSAVRADRGRPPIARCAIYAGAIGVVLGSGLGISVGAMFVQNSDVAWVLALAAGVFTGMCAGLIAWRLVRFQRLPANEGRHVCE